MSYDPTNAADAAARGLSASQLDQIQTSQGLSNRRISRLSDSALRRLLRKLELPDRPRARAAFRRLQEVDDQGTVPSGALLRALQQLDSVRARAPLRPRVAGVPTGPQVVPRALSPPPPPAPAAGLQPGAAWTSLGPGGVGGRTRSIVIHPGQPNRMWIGSVGGGVWFTQNGGANWHPVDDRMANLAVCCLVMDPTNPLVIYAGTGEGFFNIDALRGAGTFRTTDGTTWAQLPATSGPDFHYVNRLALSADGGTLLAATRTGIHRSIDPDRLIWTRVLSANVADVKFHPTDPQSAIAGDLRNGTAYCSGDGGATWQVAAHPQPWTGRVELAYARQNPNVVYASVDTDTGQIWRSTDGGRTYTRRGGLNVNGVPASYLGQQGWYDNVIWVGDPTNADLVLVGGVDLWRSTDGGQTLSEISDWANSQSVHADHHAIVAHPSYDGAANRVVYFGNDGGIYRGADATTVGGDPDRVQGWTNLVNGYAVTQFYGGAGNPTTGTIVGGAQDNGTLSFLPAGGASQWREILGGDGGYCAADPNDPMCFYAEYVYLNIHRNTDGATSDANWWEHYISGQFFNQALGRWDWKPRPFQIPDAMNQDALFIAPFVLDPNNSQRILAGGLSLWRTNDARTPNTNATGPSWAAIKPSTGAFISALAVAAGDADLVWIGHENGEVYRALDGTTATPTWVLMGRTGPSPLTPARFCTQIVIDPTQHPRVYVTFGGYTTANVWRTEDAGQSWVNLGASLPEAPVRALAIHPRRPAFLYLGTEVGMFTSEDRGATWSPTNEGPTNCSVDDLFWMGETLISVTHGRGMFAIDLSGV